MLRDKIKTLISRYDQRVIRLDIMNKGVIDEKYTVSKGEIHEYKYIINQLNIALGVSDDYTLSYYIGEILQTQRIRRTNFQEGSVSALPVAPEYKGRSDVGFKIIQDLKGLFPQQRKLKEATPPFSNLRNLIICKE